MAFLYVRSPTGIGALDSLVGEYATPNLGICYGACQSLPVSA
jgi:hypothetical protein